MPLFVDDNNELIPNFHTIGEDARYLSTKSTQRPPKEVVAIFDELLDFNGNEKFRNLMRYRFFGTNLPEYARLQIFLDYDSRINDDLSDLDKVYLPLLKIERKIIFEYPKYAYKVISKKREYCIKWDDANTMEESMARIIAGLKKAKRRYSENYSRRKGSKKRKRESSSLFETDEEHHGEENADENVAVGVEEVVDANPAENGNEDGVVEEKKEQEHHSPKTIVCEILKKNCVAIFLENYFFFFCCLIHIVLFIFIFN